MKILTNEKYNALLSEIKNLKLDNELYEKSIKEKNKDIAWSNRHTNGLYKEIAELREEIYNLIGVLFEPGENKMTSWKKRYR